MSLLTRRTCPHPEHGIDCCVSRYAPQWEDFGLYRDSWRLSTRAACFKRLLVSCMYRERCRLFDEHRLCASSLLPAELYLGSGGMALVRW